MRGTIGVVSHCGSGEERRVLDALNLDGMACRRRRDKVTHLLLGIYTKSAHFTSFMFCEVDLPFAE
jgi:hypothetical protein